MIRRFGVMLVAAGAVASCAAANGPQRSELRLRPFASGFDAPVFVGATRSEPGRLYVVEQAGRIIVLQNGQRRVFLDIRNRVQSGGEQGLLSVAFHPNYKRNHRFFVYFNDKTGDVRVFEFRSNGRVGLPRTAKSLLRAPHREFDNHDGGQLQFGPDGRLYAGTGDGGSGGDPHNHAQNLRSSLGKLLRLNVNRRGAKWQVAGYGLRNPWRFSWDRATRDLYIADVGQNEWEEVDVRTRAQQGFLNNYGWRVWEGRSRYESGQRTNPRGKLVFPIVSYSHDLGCSITGGYVYRGRSVPAARGRYFYGDYCSGRIWSLRAVHGKLQNTRQESMHLDALSSWGEDVSGELYAVSLNGQIYKLSR